MSVSQVIQNSTALSRSDRYQTREELVTREIVGETLVVPISGNLAKMEKLFSLNATGAFIWSKLDGAHDLGEICDELTKVFEVDSEDAWQDVSELLAALEDAELINKVCV